MSEIFKVLLVASCFAVPSVAPAAPANVVAYNCIFPVEGSAQHGKKFDYLAVLIPNWLESTSGTPFDVIDPSDLLQGGSLSRLMKKESSFALAGAPSDKTKMLLISIDTDKPGVFDAVLGNHATPEIKREGQCAAMGEKARESFEFWRVHPDRIGDAP
ncbi:hypothetical protein H9L12_00885 [Sphingomonas rhizophila]|uniref:Uncharacterized protein n=1 Tax=Sphingomonas rhizophila TaxID=2071607 RepID=A0A7G9SBL5_9SPHN|nr:hypothetical protein [Sphingomonas rhizophila]QNN65240.1 hypothetical protein H9L12_00885 [Sphingomonas rhizophila]